MRSFLKIRIFWRKRNFENILARLSWTQIALINEKMKVENLMTHYLKQKSKVQQYPKKSVALNRHLMAALSTFFTGHTFAVLFIKILRLLGSGCY